MGKNNFLPKCLFLLKNDFYTMFYFYFFPHFVSGVGGFFFETFPLTDVITSNT